MAVSVFGCTNTIVASDYWSQFTMSSNSTPTATRVTEIIERVAAEVNGAIISAGGVPGDIDATGEPISYHWLQHTIGLGAAAAVGRSMTGADPDLCKEYQRQFEARIRELAKNPQVVLADYYDDLSDAPGKVRTHIDSLGLSDGGDDATDFQPTFRVEDDL